MSNIFLSLLLTMIVFFHLGCASEPKTSAAGQNFLSQNSNPSAEEELQSKIQIDKDDDESDNDAEKADQHASEDLIAFCTKVCSLECREVVQHLKNKISQAEAGCFGVARESDEKTAKYLKKELKNYSSLFDEEARLEVIARLTTMPRARERAESFLKMLKFGQRYDEIAKERKFLLRLAWRVALQANSPLAASCYIARYDALSRGKLKSRDERNWLAEDACPFAAVEDLIP